MNYEKRILKIDFKWSILELPFHDHENASWSNMEREKRTPFTDAMEMIHFMYGWYRQAVPKEHLETDFFWELIHLMRSYTFSDDGKNWLKIVELIQKEVDFFESKNWNGSKNLFPLMGFFRKCFHAIKYFNDGDERIAWTYARDASVHTNVLIEQSFGGTISVKSNAKKANDASHMENRQIKKEFVEWYKDEGYKLGTKDDVAILATKLFPMKAGTLRKHLRNL